MKTDEKNLVGECEFKKGFTDSMTELNIVRFLRDTVAEWGPQAPSVVERTKVSPEVEAPEASTPQDCSSDVIERHSEADGNASTKREQQSSNTRGRAASKGAL